MLRKEPNYDSGCSPVGENGLAASGGRMRMRSAARSSFRGSLFHPSPKRGPNAASGSQSVPNSIRLDAIDRRSQLQLRARYFIPANKITRLFVSLLARCVCLFVNYDCCCVGGASRQMRRLAAGPCARSPSRSNSADAELISHIARLRLAPICLHSSARFVLLARRCRLRCWRTTNSRLEPRVPLAWKSNLSAALAPIRRCARAPNAGALLRGRPVARCARRAISPAPSVRATRSQK